jgi:hypothetical protein
MPGYIIHRGATVQCAHVGPAQPVMVDERVTVSGQAVVVQRNNYSISGCQLPAWTLGGSPPCATGTWLIAAQRVFAGGSPVVLFDSQSSCQPNGTPMLILQSQIRVTAT